MSDRNVKYFIDFLALAWNELYKADVPVEDIRCKFIEFFSRKMGGSSVMSEDIAKIVEDAWSLQYLGKNVLSDRDLEKIQKDTQRELLIISTDNRRN